MAGCQLSDIHTVSHPNNNHNAHTGSHELLLTTANAHARWSFDPQKKDCKAANFHSENFLLHFPLPYPFPSHFPTLLSLLFCYNVSSAPPDFFQREGPGSHLFGTAVDLVMWRFWFFLHSISFHFLQRIWCRFDFDFNFLSAIPQEGPQSARGKGVPY